MVSKLLVEMFNKLMIKYFEMVSLTDLTAEILFIICGVFIIPAVDRFRKWFIDLLGVKRIYKLMGNRYGSVFYIIQGLVVIG